MGLIVAALASQGIAARVPHGYALRNRTVAPWLRCAAEVGLRSATGAERPGDVVLLRPGPAQHHLAIALCGRRLVHAHAGLRRVVIQPAPLPWPVVARWRLAEDD